MFRYSLPLGVIRRQCKPIPMMGIKWVTIPHHFSPTSSARAFATHAMDLELPTPVYTPQPPKQQPSNPESSSANATTASTGTSTVPPTPTPSTPPFTASGATTGTSTTSTTGTTTTATAPQPPTYATPPPPVRKKRVKKPPPPPEDPVVAEFNAFKNRLQLARLKGEEGEHEAERELEQNETNGLHDKNKRALEVGLMEIYDTLFPLGFHSVWLYKLGKKYSGFEFTAKYLLKNKGKNWVLFVPRRQINLWQECAKDFLTTCNDALAKGEISVSDVLDIITVYHVDTLERDKYTFLDDQIEKPVIYPLHEIITMTIETLEEEVALKFYIRMITEHPLIIQTLKPEELRDLLAAFIDRISPEHAKQLKQEIKNADAVKNMVEVNDQTEGGAALTVKPRPPTTPQQAESAVTTTAKAEPVTLPTDNSPPMNPASS